MKSKLEQVFSKIPKEYKEQYDLQTFYEYMLKNRVYVPLYRGIRDLNEKVCVVQSPMNAVDSSVDRSVFTIMSKLFKDNGYTATPSNSIFVTFDEKIAKVYGYVGVIGASGVPKTNHFYVFPIGMPHFTFSKKVADYKFIFDSDRKFPPQIARRHFRNIHNFLVAFYENLMNKDSYHFKVEQAVGAMEHNSYKFFWNHSYFFLQLMKQLRTWTPKQLGSTFYINTWMAFYDLVSDNMLKPFGRMLELDLDPSILQIEDSGELLKFFEYYNDEKLNLVPDSHEIMMSGKFLLLSVNYF